MVDGDSVFSPDAFTWVNVVIGAAIVDTGLVLGIWALLSFGARAKPPGLMLAELALVVSGAVFALLTGGVGPVGCGRSCDPSR